MAYSLMSRVYCILQTGWSRTFATILMAEAQDCEVEFDMRRFTGSLEDAFWSRRDGRSTCTMTGYWGVTFKGSWQTISESCTCLSVD